MIIGFSTTGSWISKTIRWVTRSRVSHSYIRTKIFGKDVVIHADWAGVVVEDYDRFAKKVDVKTEYTVSAFTDADFKPLISQLGLGYDYGGLLGEGVVFLGRIFGRRWGNPWQSEDLWYCSELIAWLLKENGHDIGVPPSMVDPQLLMDFLESAPFAIKRQ